jgi:Flp pilus assembly protein TadG
LDNDITDHGTGILPVHTLRHGQDVSRSRSLGARATTAWRRLVAAIHDDRGAVAVSFVMTLPIFLVVVGIFVQLALLVNARIMCNYAAEMTARAAITALPENNPDAVSRAARFAFVPLSPQAKDAPTQESLDMASALAQCQVNVPASFAARYTYATDATTVSWDPPIDWQSKAQPVTVTVRYRYYLTVPLIMKFLAPQTDTVGGISGHFITFTSTCTVETSHSRRTASDGNGWPQ